MESVNLKLHTIINIFSKTFFTLIQLDKISCRFDFIPPRLVNISGRFFLIWSRLSLISCPIDNISCKTYLILIQRDNTFCRCTFIPSRVVNILSGTVLIWSRLYLILCPIFNIYVYLVKQF